VRVALVVNGASGGGLDPALLVRAMSECGADVTVHGCTTTDLERVAREAPERVAVAGGDGTIAPVAELAGRLRAPLAVIPGGTANDFVRAAGLPLDRIAAAELAATGTALRRFELGRLGDGRPFVNVASAGLASVAARRAAPLKPRLGPLAYGVGAVARQPPRRRWSARSAPTARPCSRAPRGR
jgi:diacylglycerol kinase (ATP)